MIVVETHEKELFRVNIGRLGENDARKISFDVGWILKDWPDAAFYINNRRPGDDDAYPVPNTNLERVGNKLYWTVQSGDLTTEGNGECEIMAIDSGAVVKSIIYRTKVERSLSPDASAPEPWMSWIIEFAEFAEKAIGAIKKHPHINDNNTWEVWDVNNEEWEDTGVSAVGPQGPAGPYPECTIEEIEGGHRVTFTDDQGDHSFDVYNGETPDIGTKVDKLTPVIQANIGNILTLASDGGIQNSGTKLNDLKIVRVKLTFGNNSSSQQTSITRTVEWSGGVAFTNSARVIGYNFTDEQHINVVDYSIEERKVKCIATLLPGATGAAIELYIADTKTTT